MAEYIERESLIEKCHWVIRSDGTRVYVCHVEDIETAPAADVTPVKHGKWIDGDPICPICGEDKFKDLDADIWSDWKPKHCPNCGAPMDGGENDG